MKSKAITELIERLYCDENKDFKEISNFLRNKHGINLPPTDCRDRIRKRSKYKKKNRSATTDTIIPDTKASFEYRANGDCISERIIEISKLEDITPELMMEKHGLVPEKWEVVAYRNNFWQNQTKGGEALTLYQSRLTVKPKKQGLSLEEIDEHFAQLDRKFTTPIRVKPRPRVKCHRMAEVNLADLHFGKLCWHGDTGNNFDYKIATQVFRDIIERIYHELPEGLDYITFVWANDFFNSDTIEQTTTAGTRQDVDVRWQKMFNKGVELLVEAITLFSELAPVKTFYTPSNHDEVNGYHALKYIEAWFRNDSRVEVDTDAYPRKYQLYGNTLIGYCHGDKENSKGTKEKASRLASLMPIEASELWSKSRYREMHTAHLHSEHMIEEINGVIVRRVSSPTAADTYHATHGYMGAVRKAQTFIYDKNLGLVNVINTPVITDS